MKKAYIIPQTLCVTVQTQCILTGSTGLSDLDPDGGTVGTGGELDEGYSSDSRRRSLWDDEESEE